MTMKPLHDEYAHFHRVALPRVTDSVEIEYVLKHAQETLRRIRNDARHNPLFPSGHGPAYAAVLRKAGFAIAAVERLLEGADGPVRRIGKTTADVSD
jgi:hypothetical protein